MKHAGHTTAAMIALALGGCGSDLFLALPAIPEGGSGLIALEQAAEATYVATRRHGVVQLDFERDRVGTVALATFESSLEALALAPGRVASNTSAKARPLPDAASIFVASFDGEQIGSWLPQTDVPDTISPFRLAPLNDAAQCGWRTRPRIELSPGRVRHAVPFGDGAIGLIYSDRLTLIAEGQAPLEHPLPAGLEALPVATGGRELLAQVDARGLARWELGAPAVTAIASEPTERIVHARRIGDDVVLVGPAGALFRFDGAEVRRVGDVGVARWMNAADDHQATRWLAADDALFRLDGDALTPIATLPQAVVGLHATGATLLAALRAGTVNGRFTQLTKHGEIGEELHDTGPEGFVDRTTQTDRGVTYLATYTTGAADFVAVYHFVPGFGPCDGALARFEGLDRALVPFADGFAVVIEANGATEVYPFGPP